MAISNPFIQFPITEETAEGVVHIGIIGPCADGTYTVVAVCPDSRRKVYYETGHEYSTAVHAAEHYAAQWFSEDEPQLVKPSPLMRPAHT